MLKQAKFKNFTTLPNETMLFASGLNVIVAENGCGKTHLLKAIYSLLSVNTGKDLSKTGLQKNYADKLMDAALELAREIAKNGPVGVAQAKFAINYGSEASLGVALPLESKAYEVTIPTKDRLEALAAFAEKRKPNFTGE